MPQRLVGLCLLGCLGLLVSSCGDAPPLRSVDKDFRITTALPMRDGLVAWDPNLEPTLSLTVTADLPADQMDRIIWTQTGWQVDLSAIQGPTLEVPVTTPGCGPGGWQFDIFATLSDHRAAVTVQMAPLVCFGGR